MFLLQSFRYLITDVCNKYLTRAYKLGANLLITINNDLLLYFCGHLSFKTWDKCVNSGRWFMFKMNKLRLSFRKMIFGFYYTKENVLYVLLFDVYKAGYFIFVYREIST